MKKQFKTHPHPHTIIPENIKSMQLTVKEGSKRKKEKNEKSTERNETKLNGKKIFFSQKNYRYDRGVGQMRYKNELVKVIWSTYT